MPNKDWYWDRFDVDVKSGQLDLSDAQTSAIRENENIDDETAVLYETWFIDDLYGTDERVWTGDEEGPRDDGTWGRVYDAEIGQMGSTSRGASADEHVTWGLDLKRDWTGKENLKVGTKEHYKWQTTGDVDWPHYYNDNAYQAAFKEYRTSKEGGNADDWSNLKDYFQDKSHDAPSDKQKVDFLNWARTYDAPKKNEGDWWKDWDNKYVDQFDPEKAEPYTPTYLDVPDLWGQAEFEAILEPITVTQPEGLPTLENIQRTQVKAPESIKAWGDVKSAPTGKFKPGGAGE